MKIITKYVLLLILLVLSTTVYSQNGNDINTIRRNFNKIYVENDFSDNTLKESLIKNQPGYDVSDRVVVELQQLVPTSSERITEYLQTLNANGSWRDIDYKNGNRSGWEPSRHVERILEMVIAYLSKESFYYGSDKLEIAVHNAMNYWFDSGLRCSNWWYNEIGVPRTLGTAFILFMDRMSDTEIKKAIVVMENSKIGMTGQNKVWLSANVMMRGVLAGDDKLISEARNSIVSEITTGKKEGIKDDWCFHQHGSQQQFGNYGLAYVYTMSLLSGMLSGTSMAFTKEQLDIISSLIEKGYQWIIWNGGMDVNALGRQLFVSAPVHKALSMAIAASKLGGDDKDCKNVSERFINNCFSKRNSFTGMYHFWQSDYSICRRKDWMTSLKMASTRVTGAECMNGDNMKGYYMADGAMYLYKNGDEYLDIFPLWDWRKLPGITCYDDSADMPVLRNSYKPGNDEAFVGGLSDGACGISTMQLKRDGLKARKTWIFEDSMIICLGSGIESDSALNVTTSVEQCWAKGGIRKIVNQGHAGTNSSESVRILHDNTGYILWNNVDDCTIERRFASGSWHDIMNMYSKDKQISGEIFSIYINHGKAPADATYCYAIVPNTDYRSLKELNTSDIAILENNSCIQAVYLKNKGICWVSVSQPVTLNINSDINLDFRTAGLYKVSLQGNDVDIMYSDPTQALEKATVYANGKEFTGNLPKGKYSGTSIKLTNKFTSL